MVKPTYTPEEISFFLDEYNAKTGKGWNLFGETPIEAAQQTANAYLTAPRDAAQLAEDAYYRAQDEARRRGGGKEPTIKPYEQYLAETIPPVNEVQLPPEPPIAYLQPEVIAEQPTRALPFETPVATELDTPCTYGMCEGLSTIGETLPERAIWSNGNTTVVRGPGPGGVSRFSELAGAGFMEAMRMTPQVVESQRRGAEIEQFAQLQRTPEWNDRFNEAFAATRSVQAATAAANRDISRTSPEAANLYARYQAYKDEQSVNQEIRRRNTQNFVSGDYQTGTAFNSIGIGNQAAVVGAEPTDNPKEYKIQFTTPNGIASQVVSDLTLANLMLGAGTESELFQVTLNSQAMQLAEEQAVRQKQTDEINRAERVLNAATNAATLAQGQTLTPYQEAQLAIQKQAMDIRQQTEDRLNNGTGGTAGGTAAGNEVTIGDITIPGSVSKRPKATEGTAQPPFLPDTPKQKGSAEDSIISIGNLAQQIAKASLDKYSTTPAGKQELEREARTRIALSRNPTISAKDKFSIKIYGDVALKDSRVVIAEAQKLVPSTKTYQEAEKVFEAKARKNPYPDFIKERQTEYLVAQELAKGVKDTDGGVYPWGYGKFKTPEEQAVVIETATAYDPRFKRPSLKTAIEILHRRDIGEPRVEGSSPKAMTPAEALRWPLDAIGALWEKIPEASDSSVLLKNGAADTPEQKALRERFQTAQAQQEVKYKILKEQEKAVKAQISRGFTLDPLEPKFPLPAGAK